jgi:hypothetical protein
LDAVTAENYFFKLNDSQLLKKNTSLWGLLVSYHFVFWLYSGTGAIPVDWKLKCAHCDERVALDFRRKLS